MLNGIRVLIVDDQSRARQSLTALLATEPHLEEIYQAPSGSQALTLIECAPPHLVLLDARMPERDGIEITREIKRRWPHIKIIVLSMYSEYQHEALSAGADAFLSKGEPPDHLLALVSSLTSEMTS